MYYKFLHYQMSVGAICKEIHTFLFDTLCRYVVMVISSGIRVIEVSCFQIQMPWCGMIDMSLKGNSAQILHLRSTCCIINESQVPSAMFCKLGWKENCIIIYSIIHKTVKRLIDSYLNNLITITIYGIIYIYIYIFIYIVSIETNVEQYLRYIHTLCIIRSNNYFHFCCD